MSHRSLMTWPLLPSSNGKTFMLFVQPTRHVRTLMFLVCHIQRPDSLACTQGVAEVGRAALLLGNQRELNRSSTSPDRSSHSRAAMLDPAS